jgi:hypothetical protein
MVTMLITARTVTALHTAPNGGPEERSTQDADAIASSAQHPKQRGSAAVW